METEGLSMSMEDLIDECGGFGPYQVLIIFGIYCHILALGWSMLQMSFAGFTPDWHCALGPDMNISTFYTNDTLKECSVNNSYTGYHERDCTSYQFVGGSRTAVTEWNLLCDRKWIPAAIASIQMTGVFVGSILAGQLSNLFGRKKATFGFSFLHAVFNITAAFVTTWEMYAVFMFFIGLSSGATLVSAIPYPMEFLPTKWRPIVSVVPVWPASVSLLALAAYIMEDWKHLNIACGLMSLAAVVGYLYFPESLRWLTLKGRYEEAEIIFKKMAAINGKVLPKRTKAVLEKTHATEAETGSQGERYSYVHLFKGRKQCITTLVFSYTWLTLSSAFYGISFGVSTLSGSLYLNIFLLAAMAVPSLLASFYFTNKFGRKWTCIVLLIISALPTGGCLVAYEVLSANQRGLWITGFSLASKIGLEAAWAVSTTWCGESFPTVIRSLGFGVVSAGARAGGVLAPFAIDLNNRPIVAYAVITCMLLAAAILSSTLPDTKGQLLADSIKNTVSPVGKIEVGLHENHDMSTKTEVKHVTYAEENVVKLPNENCTAGQKTLDESNTCGISSAQNVIEDTNNGTTEYSNGVAVHRF